MVVREEEGREEAEIVTVDFSALLIFLGVGSAAGNGDRGLRLPREFDNIVVKALERARDGRLISEGVAEGSANLGRRGEVRRGRARGGGLGLFGIGFPVRLGLFVFARGNKTCCCWRRGDSGGVVFEPTAVGGKGRMGKRSFSPL